MRHRGLTKIIKKNHNTRLVPYICRAINHHRGGVNDHHLIETAIRNMLQEAEECFVMFARDPAAFDRAMQKARGHMKDKESNENH